VVDKFFCAKRPSARLRSSKNQGLSLLRKNFVCYSVLSKFGGDYRFINHFVEPSILPSEYSNLAYQINQKRSDA